MRIARRETWGLVAGMAACVLWAGCTDKGEGLLGAGPDDRWNRGGGPDTARILASADAYYERGVDEGSHLLAGSSPAEGLEAVTFVRFDNLPAPGDTLVSAALVLYSDTEIEPGDDYDLTVSRLEEPAPSAPPYWPGPAEGADVLSFPNVATGRDTTSEGVAVHFVRLSVPVEWVNGWVEEPSSNYGVRISGGTLNILQGGNVEPRFRSPGEKAEGDFDLSPQLEVQVAGREEEDRFAASQGFFILKPTLGETGESPYLQVGDVLGYRALLRFPVGLMLEGVSVNRAVLRLTIDSSRPELNGGIFDVLARPVSGQWSEASIEPDVGIEPASSRAVEVDAGEDRSIELDVTALLVEYARADTFDVAILKSGEAPVRQRAALVSSESPDSTMAPVIEIIYTTPPGGRYAP